MFDDPRMLGLPHDTWRKGQYDAYKKAKSIDDNGGGTLVIEAPTGVGKSGIPTALGASKQVTVLVHNHGLLDQYEEVYGFDIIKGKQEYFCVLPSKVDHWKNSYGVIPTAGDCHFHNMYECDYSAKCPYLIARKRAMESNRMACTYKYAALSPAIRDRGGIIVLDEAHDCYEELIEFAKFVMDEATQKDMKFPKFPLVNFGQGGKGDLLDGENRNQVINWIMEAMKKISIKDLFSEMTQRGSKNQKMFEYLSSALNMLVSNNMIFYKCCVPSSDDWRTLDAWTRPGIVMEIRSLDVKNVFHGLLENKTTTILMSATIGNPKPLMGELGISDYKFVTYPHPTPVDKRPVFDLGFERMTKANLDSRPALYKQQADAIAKFIQSQDPSWRAIILTSSNYKINLLNNFLKASLGSRLFLPQSAKLSERIAAFISNKEDGKIIVGTMQGWGSGISLDGNKARMSIVAGVAFSNPGDRFEALRMSTKEGRDYSFWNSYCGIVQATGRVARGELEEDGDFMLNIGCLSDGSCTTPVAMSNYSSWYKEAIVKWK
jgi:Rad3-related DNA helicase